MEERQMREENIDNQITFARSTLATDPLADGPDGSLCQAGQLIYNNIDII